MIWGVVSLGLFISFRILNIADTFDADWGSFPLGAATCVILIQQGVNPFCSNACSHDCWGANVDRLIVDDCL